MALASYGRDGRRPGCRPPMRAKSKTLLIATSTIKTATVFEESFLTHLLTRECMPGLPFATSDKVQLLRLSRAYLVRIGRQYQLHAVVTARQSSRRPSGRRPFLVTVSRRYPMAPVQSDMRAFSGPPHLARNLQTLKARPSSRGGPFSMPIGIACLRPSWSADIVAAIAPSANGAALFSSKNASKGKR